MKIINTNNCKLSHIIQWNNEYIIAADYNNKSFKVIHIVIGQLLNFKGEINEKLICIKKLYHPLYGESLLTASRDNIIKLWII